MAHLGISERLQIETLLMSQGERKRGRRARDRQGFLSEQNDRRSAAAKVVVL